MGVIVLLAVAAVVWVGVGVVALRRLAQRPPGGAAAAAVASGAPIDAESAGLTGEVWLLRTRDGLDLEVLDIAGGGDGLVAVLIHDWGEAPLTMLPRAVALASERRRILIPSLRGHEGGGGRCSLGLHEVGDVERLLETLDGSPVAIEGAGLGGLVAQSLRETDGVAQVDVVDPWRDRRDGLRRILKSRGMPMWPVGSVASILWPGGRGGTCSV